jgi:hypothetical protein
MSFVQTEEIHSLGNTPTCLDATPTQLQKDRKNAHVSNSDSKNKKK